MADKESSSEESHGSERDEEVNLEADIEALNTDLATRKTHSGQKSQRSKIYFLF